MSVIIVFIAILVLIFSILYLIQQYEPMWIGIVLCILSLVSIFIVAPYCMWNEVEKEHSNHSSLVEADFKYCPYCGIAID